MSSSNRFRWLKAIRNGKPAKVGDFFEKLTEKLLGAQQIQHELADLVIWNTQTGIEVKSTSGSDGHRLPLDQLNNHRTTAQGVLRSYWYCLYSYRNRKRNGSTFVRPMSECETTYEFHRYLAQNVTQLYLFDIGLIDAIQAKEGVVTGRLPCRPREPLVFIPHRFLKQFRRGNEKAIFGYLNLNRDNWTIREWNITYPLKLMPGPEDNLTFSFDRDVISINLKVNVVMRKWHIPKINGLPFCTQVSQPVSFGLTTENLQGVAA